MIRLVQAVSVSRAPALIRQKRLRRLGRAAICATLAAAAALWLGGCGGGGSSSTGGGSSIDVSIVSVTAVSSTHPLQVGTQAQMAITGVTEGIAANSIRITFSRNGQTGASASATVGQGSSGSGNATLDFTVPDLGITSPTQFSVTVSANGNDGKVIESDTPASATVVPAAIISSVTPSTLAAGQQGNIDIEAANANFVQGATTVSFGAGVTVGGAAPGAAGPATVNSAGSLLASISIDPSATTGTRTVTVTTADQVATAANAFTISAAPPPPQPPVANPGGPYSGFSTQAIAFSGAGSTDPGGLALTYAWDFGDGSQGTGVSPTHTYAKAGTYTVKLTVTDTSGLTGSANTTATIKALAPPVVSIGGPYSGQTGQSITFDGSASSDPNQSALTYAWNFGDGSQGSGAKATHTYSTAHTYTVTLTLTDTYGETAMATTTATITAASQPPVANPGGPYTGVAGQAIAFNGSGSTDPNNLPLTYEWDFGDGTTSSQPSPSHAYSTAGTYTVKLTVSDSTGLSGTASTQAIVTAGGALTAEPGGPYSGVAGAAVTFDGSKSFDPKGEALTYAWNFGDGSQGTGVNPTHTYAAEGSFTVTLTVTNTDNATASATTTVTIVNPLSAAMNGPYSGNVGQVLSFSGNSSLAPSDDPLTYAWDFGDGSTATGSPVTHAYAAAGKFTVKLTITDTITSNTASTTANAVITQPISIAISSPAQGSLFNTTTLNVTGTISDANATVLVNGMAATVSGGSFTAANVPVREGVNLITAVATDAQGANSAAPLNGTASTSVTVDLTPPIVSISLPADQSTVTTQQITVAGMVTDLVTGTVNSNDVTVAVNGQAATVSNRSFQLPGFLLVPGLNTLNVVATDEAGNQSTTVVHVTLANATAQQHTVILSGDQQTGAIDSVLPQPLVAQLVDANGAPVPNRAITFTVSKSDGIVESLPLRAQTLTLTTDANGKASVLFQLGSRAGLGINQVAVTSAGFLGQAVFSESTTPGPPAFIHEFMGNNQRGLLGQPLAEAFQTIVQDAGGNPLANVPVTFTVQTGDGTLGGQTSTVVNTNGDGRAMATLTLGQQEGVNNYTVTADFANDPNTPVVFYASGFAQGDPNNTQVSGIVLDNTSTPVPNATVSLENTNYRTTTDANGHFSISPAPVGTVTLLVDGSTTSLAETLPSLTFVMQSLPGQNNTLNQPVYLPVIDTNNAQTVGGNQPVTLTLSNVPGVSLTIAPNSATFPDGTHIGQMSLSQIKADMIPMPPPNGIQPDFAWTLQPAGTKFSVPAAITIPNTKGLPPGQVQEFYQYDHDLEQFVSVGTLRVSPDGSVLTSDPGFGVTKAGWSSPGSNPPPPNCANSCDDNNVCTADSQGPNCTCVHTNKSGGCGNTPPAGPNNCQLPGMCKNGVCTGGNKPAGSTCDDGKKCTDPDTCGFDGSCRGIPKPDKQQPFVGGGGISVPLQNVVNLFPKVLQEYLGSQGSNFNASLSANGNFKQVCCENPTGSNVSPGSYVDDHQTTVTTSFSLQLVKVPVDIGGVTYAPFPCPSPYMNCGSIGLTADMGLGLSGKIQVDDAQCQNLLCAQGSLSPTVNVTLFAGANITDLGGRTLFKLGGQASWGLTSSIGTSGDCKSVNYSIGVQALTITFVATSDLGFSASFPGWTVFPGATLYNGSIPVTSN